MLVHMRKGRKEKQYKKEEQWLKGKQYGAFREFSMTKAYKTLYQTQSRLIQYVKSFTVYQLECVQLQGNENMTNGDLSNEDI